jgi:hypothetical protein
MDGSLIQTFNNTISTAEVGSLIQTFNNTISTAEVV